MKKLLFSLFFLLSFTAIKGNEHLWIKFTDGQTFEICCLTFLDMSEEIYNPRLEPPPRYIRVPMEDEILVWNHSWTEDGTNTSFSDYQNLWNRLGADSHSAVRGQIADYLQPGSGWSVPVQKFNKSDQMSNKQTRSAADQLGEIKSRLEKPNTAQTNKCLAYKKNISPVSTRELLFTDICVHNAIWTQIYRYTSSNNTADFLLSLYKRTLFCLFQYS